MIHQVEPPLAMSGVLVVSLLELSDVNLVFVWAQDCCKVEDGLIFSWQAQYF